MGFEEIPPDSMLFLKASLQTQEPSQDQAKPTQAKPSLKQNNFPPPAKPHPRAKPHLREQKHKKKIYIYIYINKLKKTGLVTT